MDFVFIMIRDIGNAFIAHGIMSIAFIINNSMNIMIAFVILNDYN